MEKYHLQNSRYVLQCVSIASSELVIQNAVLAQGMTVVFIIGLVTYAGMLLVDAILVELAPCKIYYG